MTFVNFERAEAVLGHPIDPETRQRLELFAGGTKRIESLVWWRRFWLDGVLSGVAPELLEKTYQESLKAVDEVRLILDREREYKVGPEEAR